MGAALIKFCTGKTDVNKNGVPDNYEVYLAIQQLQKKLEEAQAKQPPQKSLPSVVQRR